MNAPQNKIKDDSYLTVKHHIDGANNLKCDLKDKNINLAISYGDKTRLLRAGRWQEEIDSWVLEHGHEFECNSECDLCDSPNFEW